MKKTFYFALLIFGISMITFYACDEAADIIDPTSDERTKFIGTWNVDESCVRLQYQVQITKDASSDDRVFLSNFAYPGSGFAAAYGFVSGSVINIPEQDYGENWRISGTGTLNTDNKIHWEYTLKIASDESNCEADYSK